MPLTKKRKKQIEKLVPESARWKCPKCGGIHRFAAQRCFRDGSGCGYKKPLPRIK